MVLWILLGSLIIIGPIIGWYIIFRNTNALADEYNKRLALAQENIAQSNSADMPEQKS